MGGDSLYILPIQYNCCWLADGALCLVYQQHGVHLAWKESFGFGHNLIKLYSLQTQFYAATDLKIGCQWTSTTDIFTFYWVVIIRGYQKSNHCMGFKAICLTNLPEMSALQLFNQCKILHFIWGEVGVLVCKCYVPSKHNPVSSNLTGIRPMSARSSQFQSVSDTLRHV